MTPEGKVKNAVRKVLSDHQCYWFFPVQNGMGRTGIPDVIGCIPTVITPDMVGKTFGQFIAVETKSFGKKSLSNASRNQQRELQAIAEKGGLAILADRPETVEEAIRGRPLVQEIVYRRDT